MQPAEFASLLALRHLTLDDFNGTKWKTLADTLTSTAVLLLDVVRSHVEQRYLGGKYEPCQSTIPRSTAPQACQSDRGATTSADIAVMVRVFDLATGRAWPARRITGAASKTVGQDRTRDAAPELPDSMPVMGDAIQQAARSIAALVRPWNR